MSLPKVRPKSEWVLTQAAFDGFLSTLDRDRDKAGEKYEYVRLKLLKYFQWCGSDVPDIDADETINRVTRKLYEGEDVYNLAGYIYGVAKLVRAESLKHRNRKRALDEGSLIDLSTTRVEVDVQTTRDAWSVVSEISATKIVKLSSSTTGIKKPRKLNAANDLRKGLESLRHSGHINTRPTFRQLYALADGKRARRFIRQDC